MENTVYTYLTHTSEASEELGCFCVTGTLQGRSWFFLSEVGSFQHKFDE